MTAPTPLQSQLLELVTKSPQSSASDALLKTLKDNTQDQPKPNLYGPLDIYTEKEARLLFSQAQLRGLTMILFEDMAKQLGGKPTTNLVLKIVISPMGEMPYFDWLVVVNDPSDAERILRTHVKKSKVYGGAFLGDGVLSTNKNDYWIAQRKHLQEAFYPNSVFATQVFPKSLARAKYAARELMAGKVAAPVEMNEFLLNEAMAQLQLALIGESQEFMDRTNKPIRQTFEAILTPIADFSELVEKTRRCRREIHAWSNEVLSHHPQGPLGQLLVTNCPGIDDAKMRRDAVSTFGFAGHDTTANL